VGGGGTTICILETTSIERGCSSEVNRFSEKKTARILCIPKVHFHIHKSSPPAPILSQVNTAFVPHSTS